MTERDPRVEPLPWQRAVWARLLGALDHGQLAHAVLIQGQVGVGKRVLARRLLDIVMCERHVGCGTCRSCHLRAAGSHPSAWTIEPDEGGGIGIERIRDLISHLGLTTPIGTAKGAFIAPAEAMSRPAANALLKTLEEPPGSTYFVLVSHVPSALPRTIRSRCQAFTVPVPGREMAAAWLAEHAPEASSLLDEAEMAPFEAIRLAEEGAGVGIPKVRAAIDALLCASLDPVEAVTRLRRECDAELIVRTMLRFLQQLIRLKFGQAVPFPTEERERLSRRVNGLEFARLNALGDRITRARRDLRQSPGLNEQLMLEELAVHWSSVGHDAIPAARVSPSR